MKQTTKRFISLLGGLALLVGALVLYFEFVQPAYYDLQAAKSRQLGQQLFLEGEQGAIKKVQDLISVYQAQSSIQEAVSLSLPKEEAFSSAIAQLNGLARASGVALNSVAVSGGDAQGAGGVGAAGKKLFALQRPVKTLIFNARFSGSYEDLKEFLSRLETNIRIFDVTSLSLHPGGGEGGGSNSFTYELSLATYYQPSGEAGAASNQLK